MNRALAVAFCFVAACGAALVCDGKTTVLMAAILATVYALLAIADEIKKAS